MSTVLRVLSFICLPVFFVMLFSCAPPSFVIMSADLYPLYVYDPESEDITSFAALRLGLESGDTDLRKIRLEQDEDGLFWEFDLEEDALELSRRPQPVDEEYVSPAFAIEESGSATEFFYPWFLGPGEGEIPDGIYTLIVWDYSGQSSKISLRYQNLAGSRLEDLETHLLSLNPFQRIEQGSYDVIYFQDSDSLALSRMTSEEYLLSFDSLDRITETSINPFLWGVPTGIDCLVLAGPY